MKRSRMCRGPKVPDGYTWRNLVPSLFGIPYRSLINYEECDFHFPEAGLYIPKLEKLVQGDKREYVFYKTSDLMHIRYVRGLLGQKDCTPKKNNSDSQKM